MRVNTKVHVVLTCIGSAVYARHMRKKTPLAVKFDASLLERLDRFVERQPIAITRTSAIEAAVRQMLDREELRDRPVSIKRIAAAR